MWPKQPETTPLQELIPLYECRDNFLIMEEGSVCIGYALEHYPEEALDAAGYTTFVKTLASTLRSFPVDTVIQQIDSYEQGSFSLAAANGPELGPIPQFFYDKQLAYYQGRGYLAHQAWLYLCFSPTPGSYQPHQTFFASSKAGLANPFSKLERTIATAQQYSQEFEAAIPSGWGVRRLRAEENIALLYGYFNLDFIGKPTAFENTLCNQQGTLQVGPNHLAVVSMISQAAQPLYHSRNEFGLGKGVTAPFTWPLTHYLPFPHLSLKAIRIQDTEQWLRHSTQSLEWSQAAKRSQRDTRNIATQQSSLAVFEEGLKKNQDILVKLDCLLMPYGPPGLLPQYIEQTKAAFKRLGIQPHVETYDTANLFFAAMPGNATQLYRGLPMPLETAVAYLNPIQPRKGAQQGILLCDRHQKPLYYDPFNLALDNQNAFVFGPSGSGKSFFNGKMIKDRYQAGHIVLVIDSGGTYQRLFALLGGKYIAYNPSKPLGLNPFLIQRAAGKFKPDSDKVSFLTQFLGKIWKGDLNQHPMSEVEKALIGKWIFAYYAQLKADEIPLLTGFYHWLQAYSKRHKEEIGGLEAKQLFDLQAFFIVLEPFAQGAYQAHFNAPTLDYLTDHRLVCFELAAVKNNPKLYPLVLQVLFDFAFELVEQNPTATKFIDIEEGWSLLDDSSEENIEAFFRKGRKTKTSIRLITQNIEEIKASKIAGAMKNNASTFILLYNDKASSRQEISAYLGMTPLDQEKYASLRRREGLAGYREVFIKEMNQSAVWLVDLSPWEHALLTSRPDERDRITQLIEAKADVLAGIAAWVGEQQQRSA